MAESILAVQRFWAKVQKSDDCWEWLGGHVPFGYGMFWLDGGNVYAHRFAYEEKYGQIPDGLQIDHLCRNPNCVNPDHMEIVTRRENILRGVGITAQNARRTHCPRGHPYDKVSPITGERLCMSCGRERALRYYYRKHYTFKREE